MSSPRFPLSPYQASYYNWLVVWNKGYTSDEGVPEEDPGLVGIISPFQLLDTFNVPKSFASYLRWPTNLPFNTSRGLHISAPVDSTGWENCVALLVYQNYWGMYLTQAVTLPAAGDAVTLGTVSQEINVPTDSNAQACPKFFYPNRLIDLRITRLGTSNLPAGPIYIDFDSQGMAEFNIQESVNYGSTNFSLEVLTDDPGTTPNFNTQYAILGSNYPRYVFSNKENQSPLGPMAQSLFFLPYNSVDNAFTSSSLIAPAIYWCATEDFTIGSSPINGHSFTNLPQNGGLLNVLVDIGNQRRNPDYPGTPGPFNKANLLISLIQNGITS